MDMEVKRGDRVIHMNGRVGRFAHWEQDGRFWILWPPDSISHRWSAGGYQSTELCFPKSQLTLLSTRS